MDFYWLVFFSSQWIGTIKQTCLELFKVKFVVPANILEMQMTLIVRSRSTALSLPGLVNQFFRHEWGRFSSIELLSSSCEYCYAGPVIHWLSGLFTLVRCLNIISLLFLFCVASCSKQFYFKSLSLISIDLALLSACNTGN